MLLRFAALKRPVFVGEGAAELLRPLSLIARGWDFTPAEDRGDETASFRVERSDGVFTISAPWLDEPVREESVERAVGNLAVDLIEAYLADHPDLMCLHCGAAEFAGGLVVFPSRARAGKSTLMGQLAACGVPVFCDDVLPVVAGDGFYGTALGIAPKLRLPLPARAGDRLRAFVAAHGVLGTDAYVYLHLPPDTFRPVGRRAPIRAIVLLDRRADGTAKLEPAAAGDGLAELIGQSLAPDATSRDVLRALHPLIERVGCHRLTYSDLDDAASLLVAHFARDRPGSIAPNARTLVEGVLESQPPSARICGRMEKRFARAPGVETFATADGVFLDAGDGGAAFRLDHIGAGVWNLLVRPSTQGEIVEIVAEAFPDVDRSRIETDIVDLLSRLGAERLVLVEDAVADPRLN